MISRLDYDEDRPERPRRELDQVLEVNDWRIPGLRSRPTTRRPEGAPYWWDGDEDASQSFLQAMGVVT